MGSISRGMAVGLAIWGCVLTCAAADDAREVYEETVELSFPLNSGGAFSLENKNGSLAFSTWEKNEVLIVAEKRMRIEGGAASWLWRLIGLKSEDVKTDEAAKELFSTLTVEATGDDTHRDIRTVYPESTNGVNFSVSYRISAPRNMDVRVDLTNGAISVSDVVGEIDVQSVNGSVSLDDISGRTEARSTNGRITIDDASGTVVARTTNGSVTVALSGEESGDVDLTSVNGSVTLHAPEGVAFRLEARTTHGGLSCDLPLDDIDQTRRELQGRSGEGGPLFSLRTTNGSVRVKKR